jgi:hypothetical protein
VAASETYERMRIMSLLTSVMKTGSI